MSIPNTTSLHQDRYIGKKKCYTCGVPVLMCDSCMSAKPDKDPSTQMSVRCPLCKEEGITIPAHEVELTDNGKRAREPTDWDTFGEGGGGGSGGGAHDGGAKSDGRKVKKAKAAPSNLKWGGGHGKGKSDEEKKRRFERKSGTKAKPTAPKMCKFGDKCNRKSTCFFQHP